MFICLEMQCKAVKEENNVHITEKKEWPKHERWFIFLTINKLFIKGL